MNHKIVQSKTNCFEKERFKPLNLKFFEIIFNSFKKLFFIFLFLRLIIYFKN